MGGHDPYGGGMMGGGDFFGGGPMMGGGDFFGGGPMMGDGYIDPAGGMGVMDFFHNDPYSDPYAHHYHPPDVIVSSGAAVAYSDPAVSTMILADGGNTVSINTSHLITNGTLLGGNGADNVSMTGAGAIGTINLGAGTDALILAGNNVLNISNTETVSTSPGADALTFTGSGTTTIYASQGADNISLSSSATETISYGATNTIGDTINGFASGTDKLLFARSAFSGDSNTNGALDVFQSGAGQTSSSNANCYWIQDTTSKNLYYDADANGSGTGTAVADLDTNIVITDITFVA
jgi:hypothetical protein